MIFYVKIGEIIIEIKSFYKNTANLFSNYRIKNDDIEPDITVSIKYEDILNEAMKTKVGSKLISGSKEYYFFKRELNEFYAIHRKIVNVMPFFGGFLMHGSVVSTNNLAYMFSAESGIGKTTRTLLWMEEYPESIIVNGDKPIIKIEDDGVFICGTPWCGKEGWNTNTIKPLRAIFFIERADGERENTISELGFPEALMYLLPQVYKPKDVEAMKKTFKLLKAMDGKVKFYHFRSKPTREAIRMAYEKARP